MFSGHSIPVAQLGPDFLLLDAPADHPPGPASILLRVDQSEQRWDVRLPNGISATSKRVHPLTEPFASSLGRSLVRSNQRLLAQALNQNVSHLTTPVNVLSFLCPPQGQR